MRRRALAAAAFLLTGACAAVPAAAGPTPRAQEALPTIEQATEGTERLDGFLPVYWDEAGGKLWLEVPQEGQELIYLVSLPAGIGSNDIGLDRNQLGGSKLVRFERYGRKLFMVEPNWDYRAESEDAAERKAVEDAFARSVIWGFQIAAQTGDRLLVDATDFVIRDAHGVVGRLRSSGQGTYRLDASRSAVHRPMTRAFPRNTEVEVVLTFTGDAAGGWIRSVTPTASAVTVRERHSFVALPEPGYEPRRSDPRSGFNTISYLDYAAPLGEPMRQRFIARHRLEKRDPAAALSDPVEPIVYYLDPGVPEPVRSALLEGAGWWNQAFEAAGYRNGFQVRMLPDSADPMDVRYNVINWVHRSTRGWSYGSSVVDPRTGEIIKGHVALGSLRVRQDYLIAEGLLSPYADGETVPPDMREMALARIRQLSAHEVGHTLGLSHNYIASAQGRASVMDYPHPLARLGEDGTIDLSDAYDTGIGEWDRVAITYGYRDFPDWTDEDAALTAVLSDARDDGFIFITDQDARPPGSAHPQVHLWDNGLDAAAELERMMRVRRFALDRFGDNVIRNGEPLATMEEALVPLYLHHRYQVQAAAKVLGGMYYTYALRGDGQQPLRRVPAAEQNAAIQALLGTLDAAQLALPRSITDNLPPRPATFRPHRELFDRYTGLVFDPVAPAAVAAELTVSMLLHPQRAARLVQQNGLEPTLPGLGTVIDRLVTATFDARPADGYQAEINRTVERVVIEQLMALAGSAPMPQVRAIAALKLRDLRERLGDDAPRAGEADRAHYLLATEDIGRFLDRPAEPWRAPDTADAPPGDPIGSGTPPEPPPLH